MDLNVPIAVSAAVGDQQSGSEMPAGVLELRHGSFRCLRGGRRFLAMLSAWGVLAGEEEGERFRRLCSPPPEELLSAADYCRAHEGWTSFSARAGEHGALTVYLRSVTEREYRGGHAFLAVLLPDMPR